MEVEEIEMSGLKQWTVVETSEVVMDQCDGPLLVAMQPNSQEMHAVGEEVVVITSDGTLYHHHTANNQQQVAAVEEVAGDNQEETQDDEDQEYAPPAAMESSDDRDSDVESEDEPKRKRRRKVSKTRVPKSPKSSKTKRKKRKKEKRQSKQQEDVEERKTPTRVRRFQWNDNAMVQAIKAVKEKKMSIRGAAWKFEVPYSTLKDRIHGRVQHGTKPGVKPALNPEEEKELVKYIHDIESRGFTLRGVDVRDRAGELLQLNRGADSPYIDCSPGHNWLSGFVKRNPDIQPKKLMQRRSTGNSPTTNLRRTKDQLKSFYDTWAKVLRKQKVSTKPEKIFTLSEMTTMVHKDTTILLCGSAAGHMIPPFLVMAGHRNMLNDVKKDLIKYFGFAFTWNGALDENVFLHWFQHFLNHTGDHRPCILIMGKAASYISMQLYRQAREAGVTIVGIPPSISHCVLPFDKHVIDILRTALAKRHIKWEKESPGRVLAVGEFCELLRKAWKRGLSMTTVTMAFTRVGIFPLNKTAYDAERVHKDLNEKLSQHNYASMDSYSGAAETYNLAGDVSDAESGQSTEEDDHDDRDHLIAKTMIALGDRTVVLKVPAVKSEGKESSAAPLEGGAGSEGNLLNSVVGQSILKVKQKPSSLLCIAGEQGEAARTEIWTTAVTEEEEVVEDTMEVPVSQEQDGGAFISPEVSATDSAAVLELGIEQDNTGTTATSHEEVVQDDGLVVVQETIVVEESDLKALESPEEKNQYFVEEVAGEGAPQVFEGENIEQQEVTIEMTPSGVEELVEEESVPPANADVSQEIQTVYIDEGTSHLQLVNHHEHAQFTADGTMILNHDGSTNISSQLLAQSARIMIETEDGLTEFHLEDLKSLAAATSGQILRSADGTQIVIETTDGPS